MGRVHHRRAASQKSCFRRRQLRARVVSLADVLVEQGQWLQVTLRAKANCLGKLGEFRLYPLVHPIRKLIISI